VKGSAVSPRLSGLLLAAAVLLGACAPAPAPSANTPTRAPQTAASSAAAPGPAASSVAFALADGRSHPGPYFLGRADAPIVLDEYADFQ
jgi:hypothetical protein